jgi:cell division protein FtsB
MPNSANLLEGLKNGIYKKYAGDASSMLLHLGTLGWILSAIAQVGAIVKNDKETKEEKKFLIPQEIADGVVNILSFYIVTAGIQKGFRKLAGAGFIRTKAITDFCVKHDIPIKTLKADIRKSIDNIVKKNKDILETCKDQISQECKGACIAEKDEFENFDKTQYKKFEGGVKMAGNLLGAIVSSNILTPFLRNIIASHTQRYSKLSQQVPQLQAQVSQQQAQIAQLKSVNSSDNKPKLTKNTNLLTIYNAGNMKV